MRAVVCTRYGDPDVLELRDVAKPRPRAHELLIRIHATTVSASDCLIRSGIPTARLRMRIMMHLVIGMRRPRRAILGAVLAGEVEATGNRVTRFRPGDRVLAFTRMRFGCYAEYSCVPQGSIVALAPSHLSYEQAAALPYGGLLALHCLRKASIATRKRVLVYGASGSIGTAAVQLAQHFGARVDAVCSTANVPLVAGLGAESVLDYATQQTLGEERYDLVFDAVGRRKTSPLKIASTSALTPNGIYLSIDDGLPKMSREGLLLLANLAESGTLRPVIDRTYPLERIADAHRYAEGGHVRGNVIIAVQ